VLAAGCFPEIKPPVITGNFTLKGSSVNIAPSTVDSYSSLTGSSTIRREPPPKNKNMMSTPDGGCQGEGGFSDVKAGKSVVVYNQGDEIIGTGELSVGRVGSTRTFTNTMPAYDSGGDYPFRTTEIRDVTREDKDCIFTFKVATISPAKFYRIEVANRGKQTYSAKDMAARDHSVSLVLGEQ
jgi:hypothetical protein